MLFSSLVVGVVAFLSSSLSFVLFYICQLSCVYVWIFIRFLVHEYPQSHPDETQSADNDKSHFPAVAHAHALEVGGPRVGIHNGAISAPMVEPALNMEVEKARSFFGKYSAVTLMAAGKFLLHRCPV